MIHSYVIGRGNTATAYLQAGMIRPVPDATADAVVDVQVQRTGGESRLKDEEVVLFFLAEKRAERTCGEEKMATPGWTEKKRSSAPMRRGSVPQKIYWEGINLNKISKKIVSAVTMGAFALTLIPAAAFAAPKPVETEYIDLTQTVAKEVNVEFNKAAYDLTIQVSKDGQPVELNVVDADGTAAGVTNKILAYQSHDDANAGWAFDVEFTAAGEYTIDVVGATAEDGTQVSLLGGAQKVYVSDAVSENSSRFLNANGVANTVSGTVGETKTVEFDLRDAKNNQTDLDLSNLRLWIEDTKGNVVKDAVTLSNLTGGATLAAQNANGVWVVNGSVSDGDKLSLTFNVDGDYVLCAGTGSSIADARNNAFTDCAITVAPAEVITNTIAFTDPDGNGTDSVIDVDNTKGTVWTYKISDEVTPSDTKVYTVTGVAYTDAAQKNPAANEILAVSADKGLNLTDFDEVEGYTNVVKTNDKGEFSFKFSLEDAGQYEITVREVNGDASATLLVKQGDVDAASIDVVEDGGMVLAGNDTKYAGQVYAGKTEVPLSDAVKLSITDVYGRDAVGYGPIADEWAANKGGKHDDAVRIISRGDGSELKAEDINLVWDENAGVYTIAYVGDNAAKDLVPGDYSVRIALRSGGNNAVTVNFTVAKFGTVQELVLDMYASDRNDLSAQNNAIRAIDDTVALGQEVNVQPKYVDENGLKVDVPNYAKLQVGINGDAVDGRTIARNAINFATALNKAANYDLVGSTITVKVNDPSLGAIGFAEKELTVVKNYLAETVSIDPTEGVVGEANTVNVSVVDADGNVSKVNGELTATIVGQSDEEATVDLKVVPQVKNGKATMYLESDKAGTVDVRVVVSAKNGELYADTFTYTFGDEDEYAGRYVVMTIGSSDYLINNEIVKGDAAPYVDDAWRTMVPFRVLGEAFGAEVDWNQEAQSVTYTVGDTEIVMTIGENTYTLNGEEQTMDTAPVLSGDRTYVPVRFVAEDLGFEVTPLYDVENGATASVVFQK